MDEDREPPLGTTNTHLDEEGTYHNNPPYQRDSRQGEARGDHCCIDGTCLIAMHLLDNKCSAQSGRGTTSWLMTEQLQPLFA
eukprot:13632709-Heterocapsa_arctica.AAC.1